MNQPDRDTNTPSLPKLSFRSSYTRRDIPSFHLLARTLVDVANVVSLVHVLVIVLRAVVCEDVGSCPGGNTVGNVSTGPPPERFGMPSLRLVFSKSSTEVLVSALVFLGGSSMNLHLWPVVAEVEYVTLSSFGGQSPKQCPSSEQEVITQRPSPPILLHRATIQIQQSSVTLHFGRGLPSSSTG